MIKRFINLYKRRRTAQFLAQSYQCSYAFVGMGQHSLVNLYPVLNYLGVPLKYICVTSEQKARHIEEKYRVRATTSLGTIINDPEIRGVFVSASPSAHFSIASQVLKSGKSLFIEKPPCQSLAELEELIELKQLHSTSVAIAGLQKRYAPAVQLLRKRLRNDHLISYELHYLTGNFPEGDALLELYIHPLDIVTVLFGKPEILACKLVAKDSYILMLQHHNIIGTLELSTAFSWTSATETLKICTSKGIYNLTQMEELTYEPRPSIIFGIPIEKVLLYNKCVEYLYSRNNFTPTLINNQIYSQGYFNELHAFINAVEGHHSCVTSSLESIRETYILLDMIKKL